MAGIPSSQRGKSPCVVALKSPSTALAVRRIQIVRTLELRLSRAVSRRRPRPAQRRPPSTLSAPVCFVGTLVDILHGGTPPMEPSEGLSIVPGWLAWPLPFSSIPSSAEEKKTARRQALAQRVQRMMGAARGEGVIELPLPPGTSPKEREEVVMVPTGGQLAHDPVLAAAGLNNAIPFSVREEAAAAAAAAAAEAKQPPVPPAAEARVVLPWLLTAAGKLDEACAESLASRLALSRLQVLDLSKMVVAQQTLLKITNAVAVAVDSSLPPRRLFDEVMWVGPRTLPGPAVAAAASLHRLAHRCGGAAGGLPPIGGTAAVLTYHPQDAEIAAEALALYLHLYQHFDAKAAAAAAAAALQLRHPPSLSTLEAGVEEMAACGKGWHQRVVLEWPYSGGRVEAAGDVVGGWENVAPLAFNVRHRKWRIQLWGLPPGLYSFKFIVDGRWCTDIAAPSEVDSFGNTNNLVLVPGCVPAGATAAAVDEGDGMAAGMPLLTDGVGAAQGAGGNNLPLPAAGAVALPSREAQQTGAEVLVTPKERIRLARFGAAIMAYYNKAGRRPGSRSSRDGRRGRP